jgi:peroxin-16
MPEREVDPATISQTAAIDPSPVTDTPDHIKNNRLPTFATKTNPLLSTLPAPGKTAPPPIESYLMGKALDTSAVRAPITLQSPIISPKDWVAEVLYILRPLIYGEAGVPFIFALAH